MYKTLGEGTTKNEMLLYLQVTKCEFIYKLHWTELMSNGRLCRIFFVSISIQ